jgi:hypothetical protein
MYSIIEINSLINLYQSISQLEITH